MAESNRACEARMEPSATKRKPRVGVVLLNLGGPDRIQDVGPFQYNLFSDPEIIRLPVSAMQTPSHG
jgi:protoporphyrin/coproporphyrin ferrochelatase